jgi:hypothetical protein
VQREFSFITIPHQVKDGRRIISFGDLVMEAVGSVSRQRQWPVAGGQFV